MNYYSKYCQLVSVHLFFRGQLFKAGLALTLGSNLINCFSLCISMHPLLLRLEKKTNLVYPNNIYKKIFSSLQIGSWKIGFEF